MAIFIEPNFAAVTCSVLCFVSLYLIKISEKKVTRVLWGINIFIQFVYIVLSASRTALVTFLIGVLIYAWLNLRTRYNQKNVKDIFKLLIATAASVVLAIVSLYSMKVALEAIPVFEIEQKESDSSNVQTEQSINKATTDDRQNIDTSIEQKQVEKRKLDRTDLEGKDVSNLRFGIWEDCLKIAKSKWLFGTSPRNIVNYAKENYINTYTAKGFSFGNGYVAVVAGTGLVGTIIVVFFMFQCIKKIGKHIFKHTYSKQQEKDLSIISIVIVCMVAVAAGINHEIFLINSLNTAFFWLMLGTAMTLTARRLDDTREKVGIITIHHADNYGSALQAFATQKIINNLGYNAIFVNHMCKQVSKEYGIKRVFAQKNLKAMIETIIRITILYPSRINFRNFRDKFFAEQEELKVIEKQQQFKKFVVGSDQVWNYKITGLDKAYFLDFVTDNSKKISYASSFGITEIEEDKRPVYQKLLKEFHKIAVREEQASVLIKDLIGEEVPVVLDPTLLLKREEWVELVNKKNKYQNYILCYQIAHSQSLVDFAQELARKTGKKIISIQGSMRNKFEAKYIWSAGPLEYINLFLHADYIVTNSFHGTAFSINFNKNFFTELLPSFEKTSSRLESILDMFELRNRQIVDGKNTNMLENVNYEKVNQLLDQKRGESINILKTFIED